MRKLTTSFLTCLAVTFLAFVPANADGDPKAGKKVFNKCRSCHDAVNEKNRVGPHLVGVVGRKAGSVESYESKYSDNMKEAGADGLVWDEANLGAYLRDPKDVIPKGKMQFPGLKKDEDVDNVIAYLASNP